MVIAWIGLSVLVGIGASKKNRSFLCWMIWAMLLSPIIAVIMLLVVGDK